MISVYFQAKERHRQGMFNRVDIYHRRALILILILLGVRVVALILSPINLHGDEAQYWAWSKSLDWGYFSKPPMIAWIIALSTSLFGDAEWAVRLFSPLIHTLTSYVIFRTGAFISDGRTGFWAAAIYALMPAVWLSSGIITTDVPLLLFWALALYAWAHIRVNGSWRAIIWLGVWIGLGLLSKYAMLFFIPVLGVLYIMDPATRAGLSFAKILTLTMITALIISPNIAWNTAHNFATLSHTTANANLEHAGLHIAEMFSFLVDQFAVFGPVTYALLLITLGLALHYKTANIRTLAVFAVIPLLIISGQALLSRANANWAVTSYIGGSLLVAYICVQVRPRFMRILKPGLIITSGVCMGLFLSALSPSLTDTLGLSNSVKRVRAWPETTAAIEVYFRAGHAGDAFTLIATDNRIVFYDLLYYGPGQTMPLTMWLYGSAPQNHAELSVPLPVGTAGPILIVNYFQDYADELQADFARLEPLPTLDIDLGGGKRRVLYLWAGYGYNPSFKDTP